MIFCWAAGAQLSQKELIARAFAADDVEADFAAEKAADTEQELPSGGAAPLAWAQRAVPPLAPVPATTCAETAAQSVCRVQTTPPHVAWCGLQPAVFERADFERLTGLCQVWLCLLVLAMHSTLPGCTGARALTIGTSCAK